MNTSIKIKDDLYYIGASDRRLALFENVMPIPNGVSYNSYLLIDEKTVLLDTADSSVGEQFLENLDAVLAGRKLDIMVIHHVEPDHLSMVKEVLVRFPNVQIVCSIQASKMINQFFDINIDAQTIITKEGDTLNTGRHTFTFVATPMVHWPEVLMSYESEYKILFSADAFGTFGALSGNLYADDVNFDRDWLDDARRYYTNIVGKYGPQVQTALKKASTLDIAMICPLHGPIWRENIGYFIEKYDKWSRYEAEDNSVMIVYGSPYGHTASAAAYLANLLASKGLKNIKMYDVSVTHVSYLISEAFRCSHIVLAANTYNSGLFPPMENFMLDLKAHLLQNRHFALIQNGSWAPTAGKIMSTIISEMKQNAILEPILTLKSSLKEEQKSDIELLANNILKSISNKEN